MIISDYDKNQMKLIDEQVANLKNKNASDEAILESLIDFVPDTTCLVENIETSDLQQYLARYNGFAYFISLISLAMKAA